LLEISQKLKGLNGFTLNNDILNDLGGIYYGPSIEMIVTNRDGDKRLAKSLFID